MSFMLSLASNPYNPFTEYDKWKQFDTREGFDTDGFLARAISTSSEISEPDQEQAEEDAIDSILANPSFEGLYVKISSDD
jgi:hypothetical protein